MRPPEHPVAQAALQVVASAYGALLGLRNRHYDRPGAVRRSRVPVLSVGNLTVGGTGKTPLVAWLARELTRTGHRPAVVSRGYRGRAGRGPLVVSTGDGPGCTARESGDEPYLLARMLRGTAVVVGSDRWSAAEEAARLGADAVILDDGFQHRRLHRDLDILLLDASNPFGNYRMLPAGLLREPVRGLRRADLVLITRTRPDERLAVIEKVVRVHNPEAPILRTGHRTVGFFDARGDAARPPGRAVAFCGIGNPSRFRIDLESQGVEVVDFHAYRDHHAYRADELRSLQRRAARRDAALVTTEKDLVRIDDVESLRDTPLLTLNIEAVVFDSRPLLEAVRRTLERAAA